MSIRERLSLAEKDLKSMSKSDFHNRGMTDSNSSMKDSSMQQSHLLNRHKTSGTQDSTENKQEFGFSFQLPHPGLKGKWLTEQEAPESTKSEITKYNSSKGNLDQEEFLQQYDEDPLFKHNIDRMIKKYLKKEKELEENESKAPKGMSYTSGYTLRVKKISQDAENIRTYRRYRQILQQKREAKYSLE